MASKIVFIRHAESEANAGGRTKSPHLIGLSRRGEDQAFQFAKQVKWIPNLVIVTVDIRTQQTAGYLTTRFPEVPVEVWPLHEFTFLSPERFENTTVAERQKWVHEYWKKCDPNFVDGPGAESFHQFVKRVTDSLERLKNLTEGCALVFSHGHVMRLVNLMLLNGAPRSPSIILYRDELVRHKVPNLHAMVCDLAISKLIARR